MSKDRNIPQKEKNFQVSSKIETKVVSQVGRNARYTWPPSELGDGQPISVAWWFVSRRRLQCIGQYGTQMTCETTHTLANVSAPNTYHSWCNISLGGKLSESSYRFGRLEAPIIMDDVVCQAADRNEYLERSLFRQNGARPIFYKIAITLLCDIH